MNVYTMNTINTSIAHVEIL